MVQVPDSDNAVLLSANAVYSRLKELPKDSSVDDVMKVAFTAARSDDCAWLLTSDDGKFRAGAGALLLFYKKDDEMMQRIQHELTLLRTLTAATQGVPVNFGALDDDIKPLGMLKVFRSTG